MTIDNTSFIIAQEDFWSMMDVDDQVCSTFTLESFPH